MSHMTEKEANSILLKEGLISTDECQTPIKKNRSGLLDAIIESGIATGCILGSVIGVVVGAIGPPVIAALVCMKLGIAGVIIGIPLTLFMYSMIGYYLDKYNLI